MEEVARCHGYNNIPVTFPAMPADRPPVDAALSLRRKVRDIMKGMGFSEVINYSFIHPGVLRSTAVWIRTMSAASRWRFSTR